MCVCVCECIYMEIEDQFINGKRNQWEKNYSIYMDYKVIKNKRFCFKYIVKKHLYYTRFAEIIHLRDFKLHKSETNHKYYFLTININLLLQ